MSRSIHTRVHKDEDDTAGSVRTLRLLRESGARRGAGDEYVGCGEDGGESGGSEG